MSEKLEMITCHHRGCGHQWEPRVKNPKRCPQCQNPLWKSERPKKRPMPNVKATEQTPTAASEAAAPTPPTTATNTKEDQNAASGAVVEETPVQRLQREADERLRRLANDAID